jgi:epoxide hydrolase 4
MPTISTDTLNAACPATCPRLSGEEQIGLVHRFVEANGLRFHLVEAGQGPLVLLLHGFPEFWYGWRRQLTALAERYNVVAPDLRGYNLSDKPARGYDWRTLASDVPALIRALGAERAHVVGHDWGGVVAWIAAILFPEVVDRMVILNAPHPAAYQRELRRSPLQAVRSSYIALFQVPGLPEWLLTRGHGRVLATLLQLSSADPQAFSTAELAAYRRALLRPGAAAAMLAYYRALMQDAAGLLALAERQVEAETLLIWGERDIALTLALSEDLEAWVPRIRVERLPEASHWLQHEQPEQVNALVTTALEA